MTANKSLPHLTPAEIRVLGSLIEKSKATPDYYPMTVNALMAACNQKTSRHPVTEYDERTVNEALNSLVGQSLVARAIGGGNRAMKYKHNFSTVYEVSDAESTVLCLLFLRGPQTPGELNTNSSRLYQFASLDEVHAVLNTLSQGETPFVVELPKQPGQKEVRYAHLFGGIKHGHEYEEHHEDHVSLFDKVKHPGDLPDNEPPEPVYDLESRLALLEQEVQSLREIVERLEAKIS